MRKTGMGKNKIAAAVTGVLIVVTLGFIWGNSCLSIAASGKESEGVFSKLKPVFDFLLGEGTVSHSLFRKLAHAAEFFLLGAEISLLYFFSGASAIKKVFEILFSGLFTAVIDESIQILSLRGSSVKDVLIDFSGFVLGVSAMFLITYLVSKRKIKDYADKN